MYLLGFDIGSSSVKVSLLDGESGNCISSSFYPKQEMIISAHRAGWAEQDPLLWWENLKLALEALDNKDFAEVTNLTLNYYDKTYTYGIEKREEVEKILMESNTADPVANAEMILRVSREFLK